MKRMRKLGIVLSVLLIMSLLFAACGGSNNKDGGTTNQSSTSNGSDGNGGSTSSSNSEQSSNTSEQKEELEPVTLKMYVPGVPQKDQQLVNQAISEYLKDKINVTLDMEVIDWGSWQDKMQLKFATNEEFDILLTMSWDNWAGKIANGTIIPLDDLIEKYAKEAAAQLSPIVLNGIKWEGKTYGFPTNKEFASNKGFMVRKDLVDKYNFDLSTVKKPEDMEPFFEVIKKNEPGVTPFLSGRDVGLNIALQEGYWISAGSVAKNVGWMDRYTPELKIIDVFSDPRYMDILKLSRKWYELGYINQDAPTLTDFAGAYRAGKAFAYSESLKPGKDAEVSAASGYEWVQIEMTKPIITTNNTIGAMLSISSTSKHPDRAMMFINLLHTDKTLVNMIAFGIEGKHYVKVDENTIDFPPGVTAQTSGYALGAAYMFGNQFNNYLWANEDPNKWDNFRKFNEEAEEAKGIGFHFNAEPVKNEISAYNNKINEYLPGLITGAVDPEEVLPVMVEELKKAGYEKIKEEAQRQLDAWAAKTGK